MFLSRSAGSIRERATAGSAAPRKIVQEVVEGRGGLVGWGGACAWCVCVRVLQ